MDNNYRLSRLPVQNTKVIVMNRVSVSQENLLEVKGLTALEQHDQIELEDVISVIFFRPRSTFIVKSSGYTISRSSGCTIDPSR